MRVPKYIREAFKKRAKYGALANQYDCEIMNWLESQGYKSYEVFQSPYETNSIMLISEPYAISDTQLKILEELE